MHIQCLCFTHIWLIPRIFKYILLAKHLLRVFKQQFQYCKFLFCNLRKHPATDTYLKGRACEHHIPELKPSAALSFLYTILYYHFRFCFCFCFCFTFCFCLYMTKLHLNTCQYLSNLKGLCYIIICSVCQHSDFIIYTILCRQHNHRKPSLFSYLF